MYYLQATASAAELSGFSDFPWIAGIGYFRIFKCLQGVGMVCNGFAAPWRFIWTKFQPEIFIFGPVRVDFHDLGLSELDLSVLGSFREVLRADLSALGSSRAILGVDLSALGSSRAVLGSLWEGLRARI